MMELPPSAINAIRFLLVALLLLDLTEQAKNLEGRIRSMMDKVDGWIRRNPAKKFIADNFKTSSQYSLGMLSGGLLFAVLYELLSGDVLAVLIGIAALYWAFSSRVPSKRYRFSFLVGVVWLYSSSSNEVRGIVFLVIFATLVALQQLFFPVVLASVSYFLLFLLHKVFLLLSKPKKGIIATTVILTTIVLEIVR